MNINFKFDIKNDHSNLNKTFRKVRAITTFRNECSVFICVFNTCSMDILVMDTKKVLRVNFENSGTVGISSYWYGYSFLAKRRCVFNIKYVIIKYEKV